MINKYDIKIDNGRIIYKGVILDITAENIHDYKAQTGMDAGILIEWAYNNSLCVIRDKKLEELLK